MAVKLGEMLLKAGMITQPQLQEALEAQKKGGGKLGFNLVKLGFVKEDDITQLLSDQYGVPSINLRHFEIDESVINLIPSEVAPFCKAEPPCFVAKKILGQLAQEPGAVADVAAHAAAVLDVAQCPESDLNDFVSR